ncbi:VOC family protein [Candidatus Woesearchaeota archaeon]|nr:MAG: VOC family protein [Candidatus Woesearchaeota archaeon]
MQKITPFLWFAKDAEKAVEYYTSIFANSKITKTTHYTKEPALASGQPEGSIMTVAFELEGQQFTAINGGEQFAKFSPAISFFVTCKTADEVKTLWEKLSDGGEVRMALDKYPWSDSYGWCSDKFGIDWQIILGEAAQKITPCFLFVGKRFGKAAAAISRYTEIFPNSIVLLGSMYEETPGLEDCVKHARIRLDGYEFVLMDGPGEHQFDFTGAISFIVRCKNQQEIDHYWNALSIGGQEMPCGWLADKFGIVWQIDPENIEELLTKPEAWKAMMTMKKLDIKRLEDA